MPQWTLPLQDKLARLVVFAFVICQIDFLILSFQSLPPCKFISSARSSYSDALPLDMKNPLFEFSLNMINATQSSSGQPRTTQVMNMNHVTHSEHTLSTLRANSEHILSTLSVFSKIILSERVISKSIFVKRNSLCFSFQKCISSILQGAFLKYCCSWLCPNLFAAKLTWQTHLPKVCKFVYFMSYLQLENSYECMSPIGCQWPVSR